MGYDCNKVLKGGISILLYYDSVVIDIIKLYKNFIYEVLCLFLIIIKKIN